MVTLRDLHRYQTNRSAVQLEDGRVGKIVRVDTLFPGNRTVVWVYTTTDAPAGLEEPEPEFADDPDESSDVLASGESRNGPGITRVSLERIVGLAKAFV